MDKQELFYPDIMVQVGSYSFTQGIAIRTYSDKNVHMDWGKLTFTTPYKEQIELKSLDPVIVKLGYRGQLQDVFYGNLVGNYDGTDRMDEIIFHDRMLLLSNTIIRDTFLNCTPQDIIKEGIRMAGVKEYLLSDTAYQAKMQLPIVNKSMVQVLKQINSSWGIKIPSFFIKGVFYWGTEPEQSEVLEFDYGSNILSLDREQGMWQLTTVSVPSMQHSQLIHVVHPKITGEFVTEKVIFQTNDAGFIRTQIYFMG